VISEEIATGSEEVSAIIQVVSSNSSVLANETNEIFALVNKQKETMEVLGKVGIQNALAIQQIAHHVNKFKVS
jgi:methyl-accepting chemotaxis protein